MKRSITLRLLAFFALALLLFALVNSLLFRPMITRSVTEAKKRDMLERAQRMAQGLEEAMAGGRAGMGMGGPGGIGAWVRQLSQMAPNLWVLDESLEVLSGGRMMGRSFSYDSLPPAAGSLVRAVFEGQTPFSEGFSELVGYPTLTVGVPIRRDGRVAGALLLYEAVAGIDEAAGQAQRLLAYSGGAALAIAILLSVFLSRSFTRPIQLIRRTALRLAEGDYQARTDLSQRDEIGELAGAVDALSLRLQEASEASRMEEQRRRDFLANVAHELRTPVTVMRASLEALDEGVVSAPGEISAYHRQMLAETRGLQRLVNDLMELARLSSDGFHIERRPLSLRDLALDALRAAERLGAPRGLRLAPDLGEGPLPFEGDYARLRQMLLIVLDNAVRFSPEGGVITLQLRPGRLSILDQGPGMTEEALKHVFDRFHRSGGGGEGSGLGLTIAKEIAQRHGMAIDIDSAPGRGTRVVFSWPQGQEGGKQA